MEVPVKPSSEANWCGFNSPSPATTHADQEDPEIMALLFGTTTLSGGESAQDEQGVDQLYWPMHDLDFSLGSGTAARSYGPDSTCSAIVVMEEDDNSSTRYHYTGNWPPAQQQPTMSRCEFDRYHGNQHSDINSMAAMGCFLLASAEDIGSDNNDSSQILTTTADSFLELHEPISSTLTNEDVTASAGIGNASAARVQGSTFPPSAVHGKKPPRSNKRSRPVPPVGGLHDQLSSDEPPPLEDLRGCNKLTGNSAAKKKQHSPMSDAHLPQTPWSSRNVSSKKPTNGRTSKRTQDQPECGGGKRSGEGGGTYRQQEADSGSYESLEEDNDNDVSTGGNRPSKATTTSSGTSTRASRGSATDPQSLYARKRRERINERLRILQNLVPNGTKVDISTMLEEAVEYVKFLQLQIKLLSSDDLWMYAPIAYNGMNIGLDLQLGPPK